MTGSLVPYHLRVNKAVDREIFIELLGMLDHAVSIRKYRYVGFGGAFLEDFKLAYRRLGITKLTSLESDVYAHRRQKFNQPFSCVECLHTMAGDFINTYTATQNAVFWLDYAEAARRRTQIQEFQLLLGRVLPGDVVKLTLNASVKTLGNEHREPEERTRRQLQRVNEQLRDWLVDEVTPDDLTDRAFALLIAKAVHRAALLAMEGRRLERLVFKPLTAFHYIDGEHRMLTFTGIVLKKGEVRRTLTEARIKGWPLAFTAAERTLQIAVPPLTARERLAIDTMLPETRIATILRKLGQSLGFDRHKAFIHLDSYRRYANFYPLFLRTVL